MISAHLEDYKFCDFWLQQIEGTGSAYFGYAISKIACSKGNEDKARRYLQSSAKAGYLPAKRRFFQLKVPPDTLSRRLLNIVYRSYLIFLGLVYAARDTNDPRLPRA